MLSYYRRNQQSEYFESGYFENLIASYVEQDPTKFCTYEEFETGVDTLKSFCLLRAESIRGQESIYK